MSKAFHREPSFFTTTNSASTGYNKPDREETVLRDGRPVTIKHPQGGHQGDYDDVHRMQREGIRYVTIVNTQGNTVFYVLTNGAADMNPNSEYALDRKQKARFHGWYRLGQCPVALLAAGEMHEGHFADRSLLKATACQPGTYSLKAPCEHALSEQAARRARHNVVEDELAKAHENKAAAAAAAQTEALVAAQAAQTEAIVAGQRQMAEAVMAAIGSPVGESKGGGEPKGKRGQ